MPSFRVTITVHACVIRCMACMCCDQTCRRQAAGGISNKVQVMLKFQQKFATHYAQYVLHPSLNRWLIISAICGEDCKLWSADVEVSTATKKRAGRPRNLVSIPSRVKIVSSLQIIQADSAAQPAFHWVSKEALYSGIKPTDHPVLASRLRLSGAVPLPSYVPSSSAQGQFVLLLF
jgi:hypothetical protein